MSFIVLQNFSSVRAGAQQTKQGFMNITREEIITLAGKYISESEVRQFPLPGELFVFFHRHKSDSRSPDDDLGWEWIGYGLCRSYQYDLSRKPHGKWLLFNYLSLASYPPVEQVLQLQPPHIVKGYFQTPDRLAEIRITTIRSDTLHLYHSPNDHDDETSHGNEVSADIDRPARDDGKFIRFPGKPETR